MTKITYIPGEIANAAIDEHGNRKPVTRTQHIFDDAKGKSQAEVNADVDNSLALHQSEINALNSQNYVTVDSFNALPDTGETDTVYRVSNWDGSQQDPTVYSEYAWNGSQYVHLSTKTQIDEVFDISAYHASGGTLATYADLSAALDSNNGGGVPQSLQKGGMSVKFVRTSDNKYVQYMLMKNSWSTLITDWQNMGDFVEEKEHPIADNEVAGYLTDKNKTIIGKLMKSGAVEWLVKNSDITTLETAISDEQTRAEGAEGVLLGALNELDANSVKEVSASIVEENVASYLTDKDGKILLRIMSNGALEKTVKNSTDIHFENIEELLSYVSSEVPDSDNGVIKYLTDKNGTVIAIINNVGATEFKGGGGFDGEITKSRNIRFDAVKVLTDNKNSVVGWITSEGKVHIEELDVKTLIIEDGGGDIGVPNELITFLSVIANGTENHKFVTDRTIAFLKKQKNNYNRDGVDIETFPVISIHDDDALDYQLPQSYVSSATPETTPSSSYQNLGGFATLLFPVLKSLNLKHDGDMLGKLSCGVASEGQRIGLTPLHGMEDTFDGHLNTCGETIKALVEKEGWECICHSMTARYVSNSYLVNGIDSEFANSLLVDATYASTNGLGWSTTTCYDTVTKKNYKVKQDLSGWDECPLHYAKPYLAVSKDANSRLVINPTYSVKYQVKTWLDRCDKAGMPHTRYACGWGNSQSGWHVLEDQKYIDVILAQSSNQSNKPPMLVCPTRNGLAVSPASNNITEHGDDYNVYNKSDYQKYIAMIDECVESKSWRIFRLHAYEAQYRNEYRSYFTDYGEQHLNLYGTDAADCGPLCYYDTNYPSEWIQPLKYDELMDMIGDNINDYWNNPPTRLNINSWDEWYPCPGTTLAMFYDIMEYAISKGVTFMRAQDVLDLFGNILGVGCETSATMAPDKRLADEDRVKWFCKIGADNSFTLKH